MTDKLARQKDVQGALSLGGATLGLSALSAKGASVAVNRAVAQPKGKHALPHVVPKWVNPQLARRLDKGSLGLVTLGAGVGGISGYNFAAIQRAEAKREREPVTKSAFGVVEKRSSWTDERAQEFYNSKPNSYFKPLGDSDPEDWKRDTATPQNPKATQKQIRRINVKSGGIDPERKRLRRLGHYQDAATVGAAATGLGAVGLASAQPALKGAISASRRVADRNTPPNRPTVFGAPQRNDAWRAHSAGNPKRVLRAKKVTRGSIKALRAVRKIPHSGKIAAGAGLASAALAGTAVGVNQYRKKNGRRYTDWWDG